MSVPVQTGEPAIDFILQAIPDAEAMLDAAGEPAIAALLEGVKDLTVAIYKAIAARGFDPASAIKAADAAADAALALKFAKKP